MTAKRVQEVEAITTKMREAGESPFEDVEWDTLFDDAVALSLALAAEVDQRDQVITALLEMLNMNTKPRPKHEDFHPFDHEQWNDAVCEWDRNAARHARALEIAGRTE